MNATVDRKLFWHFIVLFILLMLHIIHTGASGKSEIVVG